MSAPPPLIASIVLASGARGPLHLEAARLGQPGDALAELVRLGAEGAAELHNRGQARLAAGALEQRDLGAVQIAHVAELFLADAGLGAGAAKVDCESFLRVHRADLLSLM